MRHSTRTRSARNKEEKLNKKMRRKFLQQKTQYHRKGITEQPTDFDRILSGDTVLRGEPFDWALAASRLEPAARGGRRRHASA